MLLYDQITPALDKPVRPETRIAVKRALADPVLTLSARVVMAYLLMDHPQVLAREQCPPLYVVAGAIGICTRTVQRAYAELEREGWLDGRRDGEDDLPDAGAEPERHRLLHPGPALPARRAPPPDLPPPTRSQQVEGFEVLRERALAANKLGIALRAHIELGRTMGFHRATPRDRDLDLDAAADAANTAGAEAAAGEPDPRPLRPAGMEDGPFLRPVEELAYRTADPSQLPDRERELAIADRAWDAACRARREAVAALERLRHDAEPVRTSSPGCDSAGQMFASARNMATDTPDAHSTADIPPIPHPHVALHGGAKLAAI